MGEVEKEKKSAKKKEEQKSKSPPKKCTKLAHVMLIYVAYGYFMISLPLFLLLLLR